VREFATLIKVGCVEGDRSLLDPTLVIGNGGRSFPAEVGAIPLAVLVLAVDHIPKEHDAFGEHFTALGQALDPAGGDRRI
jgi:hypothetical protein